MSGSIFVKRYDDPHRCAAAVAHHGWLTGLDSGVRLPRLVTRGIRHLVFEHLPGRTTQVADLPQVAATVGHLHTAAYQHELHAAHLDRPHTTLNGLVIPDFATPRRKVLHHAAVASGVSTETIDSVLDQPGLPAAFYKDPNVRNYLVEAEVVAVVDFDDLTLAPFGYDLAGLLVTASMTYGRLDEATLIRCLDAYHSAVTPHHCNLDDLHRYAELHHLLTLRYVGRNRYRYPWHTVRPWPDPLVPS